MAHSGKGRNSTLIAVELNTLEEQMRDLEEEENQLKSHQEEEENQLKSHQEEERLRLQEVQAEAKDLLKAKKAKIEEKVEEKRMELIKCQYFDTKLEEIVKDGMKKADIRQDNAMMIIEPIVNLHTSVKE